MTIKLKRIQRNFQTREKRENREREREREATKKKKVSKQIEKMPFFIKFNLGAK